jgi:hypothetical protein
MSSTPTYIQQRCTCQYAALCILRIPVSRWNGSRLTVGQRVSALPKELYCSFSTYISRCKLLESHNLWCARNIMKFCNLVCFVTIRSFCHTLLFVSGLGTIPWWFGWFFTVIITELARWFCLLTIEYIILQPKVGYAWSHVWAPWICLETWSVLVTATSIPRK